MPSFTEFSRLPTLRPAHEPLEGRLPCRYTWQSVRVGERPRVAADGEAVGAGAVGGRADLVRWAKTRWRIEHDYRELKHGLGLDHFEGRTWRGWHHHVTLVTAAQAFLTLRRLDPKVRTPA